MPKFLTDLFRRVTAADIRREQLAEAEALALEHEAAAEHHDALATMYRHRAERLMAGVKSVTIDGTTMSAAAWMVGGYQPVGDLQPGQPPVKP